MDQVNVLQIIITVLGSGALFSFLQFLIQRKDNKDDKKIEERFDKIEKEIKDGLETNEKTNSERYEENSKNIQNVMELHQNDFQTLLKAFDSLKDSDERIEKTINKIAENQKNVCDALTGLAHDKIVYMTDYITERGYITIKERATLDSIYGPYKAMGGNSHAKVGYETAMELEVISEEEAKKMDTTRKAKALKNEMREDFKKDFRDEIEVVKELTSARMKENNQNIIHTIKETASEEYEKNSKLLETALKSNLS